MKKKIKKLNKNKSRSNVVGGLIFVGALMMGLGFGIAFGNPGAGLMLGIGVGFILFGLIKAYMKD